MGDFGSLHTNAFANHTPDDYSFGGPDSQYYPSLILSPADPLLASTHFGHLNPLADPYSQSHVRPPPPRIDTTTHSYQAPSLAADQLMSPYNDGLGMPYPSPSLTPSTDSSHLATPEQSPAIHRHINVMGVNHSPISPSMSLYDSMVRFTCMDHVFTLLTCA